MPNPTPTSRPAWHLPWILLLWLAVFFGSLFAPPLLDDADATHANAARNMLATGDWVTLHVNGIRYLEKAPLPYWLVAASFRIFGFNAFAAHLPQALAVLLLALLSYRWALRAWNARAALYAATALLTSAGVFLFTRVFIPEATLSLLLMATLYCVLRGLELRRPAYLYGAWTLLALAVLTKGLIAIVFTGGTVLVYLAITRQLRRITELHLLSGTLLFLLVAAPWHILAGLRNTGGWNGHGFFWFYFINEHVLRFLGRRQPHDYNKLPGWLYWSLHLVWLFPWSLYWPAAIKRWRVRPAESGFARDSARMLAIFASLILIFFSLSTNQEYYTFPVYASLLMLTAVALAESETLGTERRLLLGAQSVLTALGIAIAIALGAGLWSSRHLPYVSDIGSLLAHRGVGDYTLSMSHFFDLTGPSFAALRLPAALAAIAFAFGPVIALLLRLRKHSLASTLSVAATSAIFLIAAHIALVRFGPMLSSEQIEEQYAVLMQRGNIEPGTQLMLYGDQAYGSSIPFYSGHVLPLVEGRSSSMWFGSTFPDAPPIFLSAQQLASEWSTGPRKVLFVPLEKRDEIDHLLGTRQTILMEQSGKALITDRPLAHAGAAQQ